MTPRTPSSPFTVLRFTLDRTAAGTPTQRRETIGAFAEPESAFATARHLAWQTLCQLARASDPVRAGEPAREFAVDDTEWGYDLRHNGQIVDRFWIHDARSGQAL